MEKRIQEFYEKKKNDITCEIHFIEGVQYNFKLEDIKELLEVENKELFYKYLYYLDIFRSTFLYVESFEESIQCFKSIINEDDKTKEQLVKILLKHEKLFCNKDGVTKLDLVPDKYKDRIHTGY